MVLVVSVGLAAGWAARQRGIQQLPVQTAGIPQTSPATQVVHSAVGLASFYDDTFQGQPTTTGELYDKNDLTAAHREYPLGALVRVTNVNNGKSVVVRINDRGPLVQERLIDLSYRAAHMIDLIAVGTATVKIELIQ